MTPDPADERRIRERLDALEDQLGRLLAEERQTNRNFLNLHHRLRSLEKWKAAVLAFALGLAGGVFAAIYWAGGIAADVRHANEAHAAVKELAKEFHEHERRAAGKAEPAK